MSAQPTATDHATATLTAERTASRRRPGPARVEPAWAFTAEPLTDEELAVSGDEPTSTGRSFEPGPLARAAIEARLTTTTRYPRAVRQAGDTIARTRSQRAALAFQALLVVALLLGVGTTVHHLVTNDEPAATVGAATGVDDAPPSLLPQPSD